MRCAKCGKEIGALDEGLSKKLINRATHEFMCISCLAEHFGVSEERLREKAREFRSAGCTLFPHDLEI